VDSSGHYEGFDSLVDRANIWLKEQRNVSILNMQSLMVQEMRQGQLTYSLQAIMYNNFATVTWENDQLASFL